MSLCCLSSIVIIWSASKAYTSLCRGLKYLLKLRYIILIYLKVAWFLIFETLCLDSCPMSEKNELLFCLVIHSFTKLSQNVFLINTHILIYWHARCIWFWCVFWVFSYIFDDYVWIDLSPPNFHRLCT